jgi:hypothetical protein
MTRQIGMMNKIAILGCGEFGFSIAKCLAVSLPKNDIILTNKNKHLREKYSNTFPVIEENNVSAVNQATIICIFTRPEQVESLLEEIQPHLTSDKLIVNFSAKKLTLEKPLINVASSPVVEEKIFALFYEQNSFVTEEMLQIFKNFLSNRTTFFSKCNNALEELKIMSRVYTHNITYFQQLLNKGYNSERLRIYFQLATETIKLSDLDKAQQKAKTKDGLTENLLNYYHKNFLEFIEAEEKAMNK